MCLEALLELDHGLLSIAAALDVPWARGTQSGGRRANASLAESPSVSAVAFDQHQSALKQLNETIEVPCQVCNQDSIALEAALGFQSASNATTRAKRFST